MLVAIVMVTAVGIVAGRWGGVRGRAGWISAVLLLAATLIWLVVEGVGSAVATKGPEQLTRGEWTLMWRAVQLWLWLGLVVASQVVLVRAARNRN